jgi:hypothetical protein
LLRALAVTSILHESGHQMFHLTEVGECLRRDAPESVYGWAMFNGGAANWQSWGSLGHSVRTGKSAYEHVHGVDVWTHRRQHPELGAEFDLAMRSNTSTITADLLAAFDVGQYTTIVDVGGGNGSFLAAILAAHPASRGILFDLPHVVAGAAPVLEGAGVTNRCEVVGGSMFEVAPSGGDAYLLKAIIHDWDDTESITILRSCRAAMAIGATVLLVERYLGPPNETLSAKLSDLNMLVNPGGRERSEDEYAALLEAAGFRFTGFTSSQSPFGMYQGVAV